MTRLPYAQRNCGRPESNRRRRHGKASCYHYTTAASGKFNCQRTVQQQVRQQATGVKKPSEALPLVPDSCLLPPDTCPSGAGESRTHNVPVKSRVLCLSASTPWMFPTLATWELNPARRAYKARQVNQTVVAIVIASSSGLGEIRTLIPSLKRRVCYPLTPRSQARLATSHFNRVFIESLLVSGSPANRTQHNSLIRRAWATSPRLPSSPTSRAPRGRTALPSNNAAPAPKAHRAPICTSARFTAHWPLARVGVEPNLLGLKNR